MKKNKKTPTKIADLGFNTVWVQTLIVTITLPIAIKVNYNLTLYVNINRSRFTKYRAIRV